MLSALEWTSSPQTAALVQVVARASGTQPDSDPAFLHKSHRNTASFLEIWRMQLCETVRPLFTISVFYRLETTPHTHTPVCWTQLRDFQNTRREQAPTGLRGSTLALSASRLIRIDMCRRPPLRCHSSMHSKPHLRLLRSLSPSPTHVHCAEQSTGFDQALYTKLRPDCAQYWRAPSFARAWILSYMASSPSCGNESANATMARKAGSSVMTGL